MRINKSTRSKFKRKLKNFFSRLLSDFKFKFSYNKLIPCVKLNEKLSDWLLFSAKDETLVGVSVLVWDLRHLKLFKKLDIDRPLADRLELVGLNLVCLSFELFLGWLGFFLLFLMTGLKIEGLRLFSTELVVKSSKLYSKL